MFKLTGQFEFEKALPNGVMPLLFVLSGPGNFPEMAEVLSDPFEFSLDVSEKGAYEIKLQVEEQFFTFKVHTDRYNSLFV